jgi:hypothetical protein
MASTYNLDKNKFYLVSEITELGPRGMIGANGLPGPVYQSGQYIEINENRFINANIETGTYLKIVGNVLSSNLIAGTNMTLTGNIINSNITSNLNLNSGNIISSIGNVTFVNNLNGAYEITSGGLGSSRITSNNILDLILISNDSNVGPTLEFYKKSITPAVNDIVGLINFGGNTTLSTKNTFQNIIYSCAYPTVGSMSGNYNLTFGGLHYLHLNASNIQTNQFNTSSGILGVATGSLVLQNYSTGNLQLAFNSNRSSDGSTISFINYSGLNSTLSTRRDYGQYLQNIRSNVSGLESGFTTLNAISSGTVREFIRLEGAITTLNNQSAVIFNNAFADIDLQVRSLNFIIIHADAGLNSVGIANNPSSTNRLIVAGNIIATNSVTIPNIIVGTGTGTSNLIIQAGNRSATAGSLAAYLNITVNGINRKIPLYNP